MTTSDCPCGGSGFYDVDGTAVPCGSCQPADPPAVEPRPPQDRTTEIALLVDELARSWTDHDLKVHRGGLLALLHESTEPGSSPNGPGRSGKVTGSPAPWSAGPSLLLTTISAGAIEHERTLRAVLGYTHLERSSSDENTTRALLALPFLYSAAFSGLPEHWLLTGRPHPETGKRKRGTLESDLTKWHREAREVLGFDRRWMLVMDTNGKPLACTACGRKSLHQLPRDGSVLCSAPNCGAKWSLDELGWLDDTPYTTAPTTSQESA